MENYIERDIEILRWGQIYRDRQGGRQNKGRLREREKGQRGKDKDGDRERWLER